MTPFQIASDNNQKEVMLLLAKHGAQVDKPVEIHDLHKAVYYNDKEAVKVLLTCNVNPNLAKDGIIPLIIALEMDNIEIAQLLVNAGAKAFQMKLCGGAWSYIDDHLQREHHDMVTWKLQNY